MSTTASPRGDRPLRIGFLGAGLIATYHSKMLRRGRAEVVWAGVHDPDTARAERFAAAAGCDVIASEDALIDGCDAVYVCTWTSEHPRLVAAAADRGRHVFCEKPLAVDLAGAAAMTEHVRAAGVTHQVGLVLRRSPAWVVTHDLVTDPAAGRVMAIAFRDDQYLPIQGHYDSRWRADRTRAGGGTLIEHSIHDVDLLTMLLGPVDTVNAHQRNHHGHDGIEDVVVATLTYGSGAVATLTSVWHDNLARPSLRRVEIICERRHVVVDGHDWYGPVTWTDADGTTSMLDGDGLVIEAASVRAATGHPATTDNPDVDFAVAAARGVPAWPDFAVALDAHRVVDALYRSAATGGTAVRVDHRSDPAGDPAH